MNNVQSPNKLRQSLTIVIIIITALILGVILFMIGWTLPVSESHYAVDLGDKIEIDPFKKIDWLLTLYGGLMTFLLLGFSILTYFIQSNHNKEIEKSLEVKKGELDNKFMTLNTKISYEIEQYKIQATIEQKIVEEIDRLFKKTYEQQIYEYTRTFTRESLLLLPEYKDIIYTINERAIRKSIDVLEDCCSKQTSKRTKNFSSELRNILLDANYQIAATGKLFYTSKDKRGEEEIRKGLHDIIAKPFPEIKPYLEKMKNQYKDNLIFPLIVRALEEIESLK